MDSADRILEARARELARVPVADEAGEHVELLVFRMAGERFGLPTASAVEVFRPREIARLPDSEAPLVGVTVWRGELLELLDLRALLGLPRSVEDALTHVAVLQAERSRLGLLIAIEREILSVPRAEVHEIKEQGRYVRAVTHAGVQVLDPSALLAL